MEFVTKDGEKHTRVEFTLRGQFRTATVHAETFIVSFTTDSLLTLFKMKPLPIFVKLIGFGRMIKVKESLNI